MPILSLMLADAASKLDTYDETPNSPKARDEFELSLQDCFAGAAYHPQATQAILNLIEQSAKVAGGKAIFQLECFARHLSSEDTERLVMPLLDRLATPKNIKAFFNLPFIRTDTHKGPSLVRDKVLDSYVGFKADALTSKNTELFLDVIDDLDMTKTDDPHVQEGIKICMAIVEDKRACKARRKRAFMKLADSRLEHTINIFDKSFISSSYAEAAQSIFGVGRKPTEAERQLFGAWVMHIQGNSEMGVEALNVFDDMYKALPQDEAQAFAREIALSGTTHFIGLKSKAVKAYCEVQAPQDAAAYPTDTSFFVGSMYALNALYDIEKHHTPNKHDYKQITQAVAGFIKDAEQILPPKSYERLLKETLAKFDSMPEFVKNGLGDLHASVFEKWATPALEEEGTSFADMLAQPKNYFFLRDYRRTELSRFETAARVAIKLINKHAPNEASELDYLAHYYDAMNEDERAAFERSCLGFCKKSPDQAWRVVESLAIASVEAVGPNRAMPKDVFSKMLHVYAAYAPALGGQADKQMRAGIDSLMQRSRTPYLPKEDLNILLQLKKGRIVAIDDAHPAARLRL